MASIIEGYNYDIFISYRQKDNKGDRWVSEFVEALKTELESTFKEEISVYFDINPSDGLLETHDVDESLKEKLKCLVFIPIISRTYCDPNSFAWVHEFMAFIELASKDQFGLKVKVPGGNVASRVLPIQIHDLDPEDKKLVENELGGFIRGLEFIYKEPGVNRPLKPKDSEDKNTNKTNYLNQINKVANAIDEIIRGLKRSQKLSSEGKITEQISKKKIREEENGEISKIRGRLQKKIFRPIPPLFRWLVTIVILAIAVWFGLKWYRVQQKIKWAQLVQIPAIQKMVDDNFTYPIFTAPTKAFDMATELEKIIPGDSNLSKLWLQISTTFSLLTDPTGVNVFWKEYNEPDAAWKYIGTTPINNLRFPQGFIRMKFEKQGFQTIFYAGPQMYTPLSKEISYLKLDSAGTVPENMVRVFSQIAPSSNMGRVKYAGKLVGEFLVDKYEVTNLEFKEFLDSGGYSMKRYWKYPIYKDRKEIPWDSARKLFVDKTGKPGPAEWEVGSYPSGEGNYPVTGVSWYEAAAYANFHGKSLPTVYHWSVIAETANSMYIIPFSNFNGKSTVPVGSMEGMSSFGIYDLAGNAREWCLNGNGINGEYYNVGGGWNDPPYSFSAAGTQLGLDRSLSNGFRCMKDLPGDSTLHNLIGTLTQPTNDYYKEKPVDDKIFNIFIKEYDYDKTPLNAEITYTADSIYWRIERVTLNAAYNKERFDLYIFIPKNSIPPFQPVIYFPPSTAIYLSKFSSLLLPFADFIIKGGRVLVLPVLKGTYERKDELNSDLQEETVFYRDHVIMWRKDIGRTIDYLETRHDILSDKVGYYGFSWGGFMGGLIPAVEKRIKAIVLHVGGIDRNKALLDADQINFLPRVIQPVLMLNGKYDMFFPEEISQKPMFNLLGSPQNDKRIIIFDTGHSVPRSELIKETLAWYDKYLGPVKLKTQ